MRQRPYALVTGARVGSIGFSCAVELMKRGHTRIILVSKDSASLEQSKNILENRFRKPYVVVDVRTITQDLAIQGAAEAIVRMVLDEMHFPIDILVNAAGYMRESPLLESSPEDIRRAHAVQTIAPQELCCMLAKHMNACGGGHILNVSSVAGLTGVPDHATYSSTQGAMLDFTLAIAHELAPHNIHCSLVLPGATDTNSKTPARVYHEYAPILMAKPETVARHAIAGLFDGKSVIIPGIQNRGLELLTRILPRQMSVVIAKHVLGKKTVA
ncbi:MAG: SDR family NAD(P)-dependent oxidoreductase [Candidatus Yonathbacteria bacterium]|nr:SDR family NAD(P)-dependent oxidoreductase [Candidatus Yonathbacteria bacterium]